MGIVISQEYWEIVLNNKHAPRKFAVFSNARRVEIITPIRQFTGSRLAGPKACLLL
jgi:hypothetical protein